MNDIRSALRGGDPIAREGDLSPADSRNMRTRLQSAAALPPPRRRRSVAPFAATLTLLIAGAVWITHRAVPHLSPQAFPSHQIVGVQQPGRVRQLQFVTAGGTRVFWTFHANTEAR